ncbi:type II RES/Xre toxin-antitoxin system antitoxin [Bradyrhizobium sp. USDA 10063]
MPNPKTDQPEPVEKARLAAVASLLGAPSTLRKVPRSPLEAHEMLLSGLPSRALSHLVQNLVFLRWDDSFTKAIGISHRTYQRHVSAGARPLSPEQSGRTWKLAEVLAKATSILGSKDEAEQWLERPAMGLNQHKPIELLATPAGVELVEEFLARLEYGVYA